MTPKQIVKTRADAAENQKEFWEKVGVCQSAGSRYETGKTAVPRPVRMLLNQRFPNLKV